MQTNENNVDSAVVKEKTGFDKSLEGNQEWPPRLFKHVAIKSNPKEEDYVVPVPVVNN